MFGYEDIGIDIPSAIEQLNNARFEEVPQQIDTAKHDHGKPIPTHCPTAIIKAVMEVRQYGVQKYSDPENWRAVSLGRHKEAMLRHCIEMWEDTGAIDQESGIEHIKHMACNLAFILAMMEEQGNEKE